MASPLRWTLVTALTAAAIACSGDGSTEPKDSRACTTTRGSIDIGASVVGTLGTTSCKLADGTYADPWTLVVPAITTLIIDHSSTSFDAFLFVRDASGNLEVQDDDSGPDTDSRIVHTFAAGSYVVYANTFDKDEVGGYTLTVAAQIP